jgi:hypothetical protein
VFWIPGYWVRNTQVWQEDFDEWIWYKRKLVLIFRGLDVGVSMGQREVFQAGVG